MIGRVRPSTAGRRGRAAAVAAVLAVAALYLTAGPATAAPLPVGGCTTTSGVVLAVDFGPWGGPVLRACGSTPTTGYQLLNQGGWHTVGDTHDGPAFVCRIGYAGYHGGAGYPTPRQDPCVLTPPASAYWSYWHADPGQHDWSYSQLGAMSYHPGPGSVDLWTFGATNLAGTSGRPAFGPDSLRAGTTDPVGTTDPAPDGTRPAGPGSDSGPTDAPRTRPAGGPTGRTGRIGGGPPRAPGPSATGAPPGTAGPATSATSATPAGPGGPVTSGGPPSPRLVDAPPVADASAGHPDHGSATPAVVTLVIVLLLAGAGITAVLRRPGTGRRGTGR